MKQVPGVCLYLLGWWLLHSCSSPKIITYAHPTADFDRYQSFRIAPHAEIEDLSRKGHETYTRLDTFIASQLKSRGYQYRNDADLVIDYEISTGLSQDTQNQYYDQYSWYYSSYSYAAPPQQIEAMVEIEMIDAATKKTVWTGSADLTLKSRGDSNVERIEQQIVGIFERFEYSADNTW